MTVTRSERAELRDDGDIVRLRQQVRRLAEPLGFSLIDQTKLVTAASELGRNALVYGGGGTVDLEVLDEGGRRGLRLVFRDQGPGIADIKLAMRDGYTTGHGLGLGLGGAKRLVSEFAIDSQPGRGTTVTVTRWK